MRVVTASTDVKKVETNSTTLVSNRSDVRLSRINPDCPIHQDREPGIRETTIRSSDGLVSNGRVHRDRRHGVRTIN